jgi:hypothetical protein
MPMLIRSSVLSSEIHGVGLFTEEDIAKDTVIWQFQAELDTAYTKEFLMGDPPISVVRDVLICSWYDPTRDLYHCNPTAESICNHSDQPNTTCKKSGDGYLVIVATRDIPAGFELTFDYRECFIGDQRVWDRLLDIYPHHPEDRYHRMIQRPNAKVCEVSYVTG